MKLPKLYAKSEKAKWELRHRIWDYQGTPNEQKADRVLAYLIKRSLRDDRRTEPKGQWSGLTRSELAKTGTCETDWF